MGSHCWEPSEALWSDGSLALPILISNTSKASTALVRITSVNASHQCFTYTDQPECYLWSPSQLQTVQLFLCPKKCFFWRLLEQYLVRSPHTAAACRSALGSCGTCTCWHPVNFQPLQTVATCAMQHSANHLRLLQAGGGNAQMPPALQIFAPNDHGRNASTDCKAQIPPGGQIICTSQVCLSP